MSKLYTSCCGKMTDDTVVICRECYTKLRESSIPSTSFLAEAIAILQECEQKWGCECPYCDRNFGNDFESHEDDCRLKRFLDTANADLERTARSDT